MYGTSITDSFPAKHPQPQTHIGIPHTLPLCEDISLVIRYQQLEIDNFIPRHVVRIRSEVEEHRKVNMRRIIAAWKDVIVNELRAKKEEVDKKGDKKRWKKLKPSSDKHGQVVLRDQNAGTIDSQKKHRFRAKVDLDQDSESFRSVQPLN
ncbi:hypothetical protein AgCh_005912 [Apium graveolens]